MRERVGIFDVSHLGKALVQGPGAGPEVTAGGVFGDLLRLAAYVGANI